MTLGSPKCLDREQSSATTVEVKKLDKNRPHSKRNYNGRIAGYRADCENGKIRCLLDCGKCQVSLIEVRVLALAELQQFYTAFWLILKADKREAAEW